MTSNWTRLTPPLLWHTALGNPKTCRIARVSGVCEAGVGIPGSGMLPPPRSLMCLPSGAGRSPTSKRASLPAPTHPSTPPRMRASRKEKKQKQGTKSPAQTSPHRPRVTLEPGQPLHGGTRGRCETKERKKKAKSFPRKLTTPPTRYTGAGAAAPQWSTWIMRWACAGYLPAAKQEKIKGGSSVTRFRGLGGTHKGDAHYAFDASSTQEKRYDSPFADLHTDISSCDSTAIPQSRPGGVGERGEREKGGATRWWEK
ncbi:hypothetical protein B0H16DRAFT_1834508 [Mycena metata]|uniref:Uncharacterized protein n=1 Tax=Mycena metata TaxID=1033252 RepID=A0AAD7NBK8_9AGAR|nr:hypothetical protein B0H16DRAFT_1834508 [Mycena metata]